MRPLFVEFTACEQPNRSDATLKRQFKSRSEGDRQATQGCWVSTEIGRWMTIQKGPPPQSILKRTLCSSSLFGLRYPRNPTELVVDRRWSSACSSPTLPRYCTRSVKLRLTPTLSGQDGMTLKVPLRAGHRSGRFLSPRIAPRFDLPSVPP